MSFVKEKRGNEEKGGGRNGKKRGMDRGRKESEGEMVVEGGQRREMGRGGRREHGPPKFLHAVDSNQMKSLIHRQSAGNDIYIHCILD